LAEDETATTELRSVDNAELIRSEVARLTDRVVEVEALVRRLEQRVREHSAVSRPPDEAKSTGSIQTTLVPKRARVDLKHLAKWVDWMQERYAATGDWLRPCWWRHGFVVEELAALWTSWLGVYAADEPPASTAALKWHEEAERCRERIRRAISTGPGCTAVAHKPEQSVTDDPRWAQEHAALFDEASESLAWSGTVIVTSASYPATAGTTGRAD
jgi:hypothetical protein